MALILGRPDLRAQFLRDGQYDWTGALRWLVLRGVRELHLWPYLSASFVQDLRARSLLVQGRRLSPLQAIVMAERPELLAAFQAEATPAGFSRVFGEWFMREGIALHGHSWLMTTDEVRRKVRQDPSGAWTGPRAAQAASDEAGLPDHDAFPDGPLEAPTQTSLARAAGRAQYRMYSANYPCAFLDIIDPTAALSAIVTGEARPAPRGGVELLSPFIEVRLPDTRQSVALLRLELIVPAPLRDHLAVRLRVRDAIGQVSFTRRFSAQVLAEGPVVIPLILRDLSPRLEISFALDGRPPPAGRDVAITFGVLRSLFVWQVIAEADAVDAPPAVAA
jgi:hypothetical protein